MRCQATRASAQADTGATDETGVAPLRFPDYMLCPVTAMPCGLTELRGQKPTMCMSCRSDLTGVYCASGCLAFWQAKLQLHKRRINASLVVQQSTHYE